MLWPDPVLGTTTCHCIADLCEVVLPALLVHAPLLIVGKDFVRKLDVCAARSFFKVDYDHRLQPARMLRNPGVLNPVGTLDDKEAPIVSKLVVPALRQVHSVEQAVHNRLQDELDDAVP